MSVKCSRSKWQFTENQRQSSTALTHTNSSLEVDLLLLHTKERRGTQPTVWNQISGQFNLTKSYFGCEDEAANAANHHLQSDGDVEEDSDLKTTYSGLCQKSSLLL